MLSPLAWINSGTLHDEGGGATTTGINQQWDGLLVMMVVVVLPPLAWINSGTLHDEGG